MSLNGIFGKKYKLESSDNFDNYMKKLGKIFIVFTLCDSL